ncbi:hypothetical protein NKG05_19815 [Oerskovia sp. M15]
MADPAVAVKGLSKSYRIAKSGFRPTTAAEAMINRVKHPLHKPEYEDFEALKDVEFEVPWGEALGIIGRNGAARAPS